MNENGFQLNLLVCLSLLSQYYAMFSSIFVKRVP